MSADELADLLKPESGPMRTEQAVVVPASPPTAAHSMVQLADGPVVPVLGAAVSGGQVTIQRGGGVTLLGPCPRVGCELERTAGQSAPSASTTNVTWPTIVVDTHSYAVASGSTVTIRQAGLYAVIFHALMSAAVAGRSFVQVVTAGSKARVGRYILAAGEDRGVATTTLALKVGDTLQASVYHTTGSTLTVTGYLEVWRVAW